MIVEKQTMKGWDSSILVKYKITEEFFFKKLKECYSTLIDIKVCHSSYPLERSIYAKGTSFERTLKSAQITHMRIVFGFECSFFE